MLGSNSTICKQPRYGTMVELWSCFSCGKPFVGDGDKCASCAEAARTKRPRLSAFLGAGSRGGPAKAEPVLSAVPQVATTSSSYTNTKLVDYSTSIIDLTDSVDVTEPLEVPKPVLSVSTTTCPSPAVAVVSGAQQPPQPPLIVDARENIAFVTDAHVLEGSGVDIVALGGWDDDANGDVEDEDGVPRCPVCDLDLRGLMHAAKGGGGGGGGGREGGGGEDEEAGRDDHVRRCCRKAGLLSPSPMKRGPVISSGGRGAEPAATTTTTASASASAVALDFVTREEEEEGGEGDAGPLDAEQLHCVVCGCDISGRGIYYRCMHIKRCARARGLSVRSVLRLISPLDDLETEAVVGEEDGEGETGTASMLNIEVNSITVTKKKADVNSVLMQSSRTASMLRNIGGSSSSSSMKVNQTNVIASATATTVAPAASVNYVLMTAARQRALAKLGDAAPVDAAVAAATTTTTSRGVKRGTVQSASSGGSTTAGSNEAKPSSRKTQWQQRQRQPGAAEGAGVSYAPEYKKVYCLSSGSGPASSMPIIVDGFVFASRGLSDTYVLTHFHSDHYDGLRKAFDCGRILCSPTTAALVRLRLGVPGSRLVPLALETRHTLTLAGGQQVDVTLVDANHCPGAVCVLFEFRSGKRVFHTGDFRFDAEAMLARSPTLRRLRTLAAPGGQQQQQHSGLIVYLDTTYCDEQYDFPRQEDAIRAVLDTVRAERAASEAAGLRTLFVFGAYGIGKERVFMAVAEALDTCVYVDPSRWRAMMCYDDWPVDVKARRLTKDPARAAAAPATLWVAPMGQINAKGLRALLARANGGRGMDAEEEGGTGMEGMEGNKEQQGAHQPKKAGSVKPTASMNHSQRPFDRVVAFQPTGWSQVPSKGSQSVTSHAAPVNITARRYRASTSSSSSGGSRGRRNGSAARPGRGGGRGAGAATSTSTSMTASAAAGEVDDGAKGFDATIDAGPPPPVVVCGEVVVYSVPYSEHSSFGELVQFVKMFKPQRIVPTVNPRPDAARAQVELLKRHALGTGDTRGGGAVGSGYHDAHYETYFNSDASTVPTGASLMHLSSYDSVGLVASGEHSEAVDDTALLLYGDDATASDLYGGGDLANAYDNGDGDHDYDGGGVEGGDEEEGGGWDEEDEDVVDDV